MNIHVAGENALIIYFGEETDPRVSAQVQQAVDVLEQALQEKLIDLVPSYASLLVVFDPLQCDHLEVRKAIRGALSQLTDEQDSDGQVVELPVYYSLESGPDLAVISERTGLSHDEIIAIHQEGEYRVYAIGFAPGFAYLGQVDERIASPRLSTPRLKVPRGAVGIADRQTAVYPAVSPGGWNLIGLCPQRMFDPASEPSMPVTVGDRVKFKAITREEFISLGGELASDAEKDQGAKA
jgi:KipI family sensor histidine kinase inhibitor